MTEARAALDRRAKVGDPVWVIQLGRAGVLTAFEFESLTVIVEFWPRQRVRRRVGDCVLLDRAPVGFVGWLYGLHVPSSSVDVFVC